MTISIPFRGPVSIRPLLWTSVGAVVLLLLWALMRGPAAAPVELMPQPVPPPPPPVPVVAPVPRAAPPTPTTAALEPAALPNLVLRGVMGGGRHGGAAILDYEGGTQRLIRVGQAVAPGAVLTAVRLDHVLITAKGAEVRLSLGRSGGAALGDPSKAPSQSLAPSSRSSLAGDSRRETMDYRLGLQPVKSQGRSAGYAVRPGARLPHLSAAGIQPGDIILSVNGSELDEERLMELSWQIANSGTTEVEYSRAGKVAKVRLGSSQ